jgi:hypothetical protein
LATGTENNFPLLPVLFNVFYSARPIFSPAHIREGFPTNNIVANSLVRHAAKSPGNIEMSQNNGNMSSL